MKQKKRWIALLLAAVMLVTLAACGGGDSGSNNSSNSNNSNSADSNSVGTPTNDLDMNVQGEIDTEKVLTTFIAEDGTEAYNGNTFDTTSGITWSILDLVFDSLAYFSPYSDPQFKLSMLDDYSYENQVLTMKLKDGLKWSDGTACDAEDIMTYFYCQVGRSGYWSYIDTLEKVDNLTIRIELCTESFLPVILLMKSVITTPDEIFGGWAADYKEVVDTMRTYDETAGSWKYTDDGNNRNTEISESLLEYHPDVKERPYNGQYIITANNSSEIMFSANPEFRKEPLIKTIRGLRGGNSQAYATAILGQEFTLENGGVTVDMENQIKSTFADTLREIYVPELSQIGYVYNMNIYPLNILEVRQAISMVLDRDVLASVAEPGSFSGNAYNAGIIPSLMGNYVDDNFLSTLKDYSYNPDEAAALLESIGWSKQGNQWVDENGESPEISIQTISTWPSFMMTAEAMSQMLSDFGFNITFDPLEFGVWSERGSSHDFMLFCTFVGGASTYGSPYECFNNLYVTNGRHGWATNLEGNDERIVTDSQGVEHNVSQQLTRLYRATDEAEIAEIVRDLMVLTNDICPYISVIEKAAPLRIYDASLHLADAEMNGIVRDMTYYSNQNTVLAKMLLDDELYFVNQ